ncbi:GIY-YIG nuclease family protein [Immundisolibacter sp.]|uniref:GIY-YIG nuclease family protein n=1 Tax=Immundisolibacter sp. TaxID=1934948 RepID=UPI00356241E0
MKRTMAVHHGASRDMTESRILAGQTGATVVGKKADVQPALRKRARTSYTYVLRRPAGEPFYVGKGIGFRVLNHEIEADGDGKSYKLNVIRQIRAQGGEILYEIDLFHPNETEALARERALIMSIGRAEFGLGPLTNLTDGGEGPSNRSPMSKEKHRTTLGGVSGDGGDRDVVNAYFLDLHSAAASIKSIPIKPLSEFKPGRARGNAKPESKKAFLRQALALLASGRAHGILPLSPGCRIPRRFVAEDVPAIIENGVLSRLINSELVTVEAGHRPDEEVLVLTERGFRELFSGGLREMGRG